LRPCLRSVELMTILRSNLLPMVGGILKGYARFSHDRHLAGKLALQPLQI
jgi:hypothetical protein